MSGLHKSPFKGFSVEFAEHRQYGPGDEIRHIDWRGVRQDRSLLRQGIRGRDEPQGVSRRRLVRQHGLRGPDDLEVRARPAAGGVAGVPDDQPARRRRPGRRSTAPPRDDPATVGALPLLGRLQGSGRDADRAAKRRSPASSTRWPSGSAGAGWSIILSDGFDELDELTCGPAALCGTGGTRCCSFTRWRPRRRSFRFPARRGFATWSGSTICCASTRWRCGRRTWNDSTRSAGL